MGTYVISDIHGCYEEFQSMLEKINFSDDDRLYLAGDYIDRGKQSLEMLKWLQNAGENIYPIKGNHDVEFAAYVKIMRAVDQSEKLMTDRDSNSDAKILYDSVKYFIKRKNAGMLYFDYYGTVSDLINNRNVTFGELCQWADMFDKLPYFHRFQMNGRDCVVVHAGFCEPENVPDKDRSLERFYIYAREEAIRAGGVRNGMIISGHTPTIAKDSSFYTGGEVYEYHDSEKDCIFYDIDCGCAYKEIDSSAALSCIRLEDRKVFYC